MSTHPDVSQASRVDRPETPGPGGDTSGPPRGVPRSCARRGLRRFVALVVAGDLAAMAVPTTVAVPGMTGLSQVSGRSALTWEESVRLDLRYVGNSTPALDLLILWKTVGAVLRSRGAY